VPRRIAKSRHATLRVAPHRYATLVSLERARVPVNCNKRVGTRYIDPDCMRKGEGRMSWSWRDLVVLTFSVLLFGAAMMANVSDGPMREYRGSWVSRASR
jgi:hypothetical protein